jgi:hypothetical protein
VARGRAPVKLLLPIYALAAFLLIVAALLIVVGVHDVALGGAGLGVALGSAVLLVAGAILFTSALDLLQLARWRNWPYGKRPPCRPLVLIAFLVMILVGVYGFLSALRTGSTQWPFVVASAVALIAVSLAGLRHFGRDARVTLPRVGTIALGLIGTIVGAWQFWYQNQYVPSQAGRAVALKVTLKRTARQKETDVVHATVDYEDVGEASVSVIGSSYTLTGSRVVRCPRPATATAVQGVFNGFLPDPQRARFMADVWEERPAKVLAAGKFVGDGKRLDPDVGSTRQFVFLVPRGTYQLLRFRAQLFAIPATVQLSQRTLPEYTNLPRDHYLYGFWHVDDDSWLHDLVYGRDRWVVMRYELVGSPEKTVASPDLRVTARFPDPTWTEGRPSDANVKRLFAEPHPSDASEPFADTELALEDAEAIPADHVPKCRGA